MTALPASDADSLSCATAGRYAGRWALDVARRAAEGGGDPPAPWLIDGFAGADLQRAALRGATAKPAAIAAMQALDEATGGRARIILVEEDPGLLTRLADELSAMDAAERIRVTSDPATAKPGEIVLVEAPFASHAQRIAEAIGSEPALVRLAPLAARALPWPVLEPIARLAWADVLLRFPREDFEKQARFTGPLADLPPHLRRVVEGCSALLDDARHGWLLAWREAQRTAGLDSAVATVLERMQALLAAAGEEHSTHALRVEGKDDAVHLLLSTPHPEHALELDGALADGIARPRQPSRRKAAAPAAPEPAATAPSADPAADQSASAEGPPRVEPPPASEPPAAVLDFFVPQAEPEPRGPDLAMYANELHARHVGTRVAVREVLAQAADSGFASEQVRAVLTSLKRAGRVAYRSLDAEGAEVEFLAEPRVPAPRPRKPRKPAPGELGLFDDPEG